jgi:hypothetical protein
MGYDPQQDFEYLQQGLEELEKYLLSDELFWPLMARPTGGGSFLKLTLGNLLFSLLQLEALAAGRHLSPAEEAELRRIELAVEGMQRRWQVAWETKAGREYRSRFNQYANLLRDIKNSPEKQAPYYSREIRLRVLLALLSPHAGEQEGYDLAQLDAFLRGALTRKTGFIWDPELQPGYPEDAYWYLYGELEQEELP